MTARRIGVLGGTFDPVHLGHLVVADEAVRRLRLDRLLFAPSGESWHKPTTSAGRGAHRVAMVRLAIEGDPRFACTTVDVDRPGPTFTIDTLTDLHDADPEARWVFITGADALAGFASWRDPEGILQRAEVVGVARPGHALKVPAPFAGRITCLEIPAVDISSHVIRQRVAAGESIDGLVPPAVADYIRSHGLYADPADVV